MISKLKGPKTQEEKNEETRKYIARIKQQNEFNNMSVEEKFANMMERLNKLAEFWKDK